MLLAVGAGAYADVALERELQHTPIEVADRALATELAYGAIRQRRLPLPSPVPWQRVVNARGRISFSGSREGSDWIQREMLIAEGIPVDSEGRLPLGRYLWRPDASP